MNVTTLASGSTGNCTLLKTDGAALLIDAGISARRIRTALRAQGVEVHDLEAILITHEHTDHISGLDVLLKQTAAPVYAVPGVVAALGRLLPHHAHRFFPAPAGNALAVGGFAFSPIPTLHDAADSCGWRVETAEGTFGLCTDLGVVTDEVLEGLCGVDCALIEANHDVEMLLRGPYPPYLKRRILSDHGHLSNAAAAELAVALAANGTGQLILGHLSRHNNTPSCARDTILAALCEALPPILRPEVCCAPERDALTVQIGEHVSCAL